MRRTGTPGRPTVGLARRAVGRGGFYLREDPAEADRLRAPGFYADRARDESLAAGATVCADVIGCARLPWSWWRWLGPPGCWRCERVA
ncbi:MAG: hypothetical protein ABIR82_11775 [Nocardioides sp.]